MPQPLLIVEDNDADFEATVDALMENPMSHEIFRCTDGDEALDFLFRRGAHHQAPRPGFVLLDLNLPGTDGREVLAELKADPTLHTIPVVVFTTSDDERDIRRCFDAGANSYIQKPVDLECLVETLRKLKEYWFETSIMPALELPT